MRERRVGTFTLGIVLVLFGVLYLVHMFFAGLKYYFIFQLWPVIFIILGGEILFYALQRENVKYKYDFAAIVVIMILIIFTMCMAMMDWLYIHFPDKCWISI